MGAVRLKIGLVLDTSLDSTDGVPQYVVHLGEWLRRQGHDVHYLVGQSTREDIPNVHSLAKNITVNFNGNRTTIPLRANRRKLKRFIEEQRFDVLHVQTPHHPWLAQPLILTAGAGTAVVGTFHVLPYGPLSGLGSRALGVWLKPSLKRIDEMTAVSTVAADFCRRSFGLEAQVIPNMVDYGRYHAAKPFKKYGDDTLTVLFLGRLVERKGCRVLLEAVAKLADAPDLPQFRVVICGRGQLEVRLKRFAADHGLEDKVEFTGFVSEADKPRYYASADLAAFPSSSGESFGIVLLEAMAAGGAAVLAGNNPGYQSVMSPRPKLLFAPKNAPELARKISLYLQNAELRKQAAAWGTQYAKNFDVDVVGQKMLAVYQQALRKRRNQ